MANIDNLISNSVRTSEELRKMAIKGGKASGEARPRKKSVAEMANLMLPCD